VAFIDYDDKLVVYLIGKTAGKKKSIVRQTHQRLLTGIGQFQSINIDVFDVLLIFCFY
jgi:hypothetical protein